MFHAYQPWKLSKPNSCKGNKLVVSWLYRSHLCQETIQVTLLTGEPVNYLICMTPLSCLQVIIILWCDHSCQLPPTSPLLYLPILSQLSSWLSLSQHTYAGGVIALSHGERGHPRGRTNVQNRMCRVVAVKESKRKVGVEGIHYYNHFSSLEKVTLKAVAVKERRHRRQGERGEERWVEEKASHGC